VLITGGAGFLGRNLARRIAADGHVVTLLDALVTESSVAGAAELECAPINLIAGSTRDEALVRELVARHDQIYHLASMVGVELTMSRTIQTMRNLEGTLNVVDSLTERHAVVFASSADVYGVHSHLLDHPMREDDLEIFESAHVNRWVYGRVKGLEENAIFHSRASTVCARIFNSYGPGMDVPHGRRVIPSFIEAVMNRTPLLISGEGMQRRAYCYVTDTIEGLILAMDYSERKQGSTVVNIGNPETHTIAETAKLVNEMAVELGVLSRALPIELNSSLYGSSFDDTWHRVPDIGRAKRLLGYAPKTAFRDGLRQTLRAQRAADTLMG
jgi:nucleoside-diphosphate-sugar epimerase